MKAQQYSVLPYHISTILESVKSGEIAIPEIQRPFVWNSTKVRDLMDSLYKGFPVGYIIAWKSPNIRLKDGSVSEGKKILIDGQQRVTALRAAILGEEIIDKNYKKGKIRIAFHPVKEVFEVCNTAIKKDPSWIPDIRSIIAGDISLFKFVPDYCAKNESADQDMVAEAVTRLQQIVQLPIGMIELKANLDIETVTEIFIRINSKGVVLSQADFAMSKIAASEEYDGPNLRKLIDYFCHLALAPESFDQIVANDSEFTATEYFQKIKWLRNENDDLYDPKYSDIIRVAFTTQFNRGKLSDLVSLLSGRNFEARSFESEIARSSFDKLKAGVLSFVNESNFKKFTMIIRSAGFVTNRLILAQNAVNFAYIVYLKLRLENYPQALVEKYVRKWFVLTLLTGRHSGSFETQYEEDMRGISAKGFDAYLQGIEAAELSEAFWTVGLVQQLDTSSVSSPSFLTFLAAQCKLFDRGFLSKEIKIRELLEHKGDLHHIFPKDYLRKSGVAKSLYNHVANYAYMQSEINIQIGNQSPEEYFSVVVDQCNTGHLNYGGIVDSDELMKNLAENSVPEEVIAMKIDDYEQFLEKRRKLMAKKIQRYYEGL